MTQNNSKINKEQIEKFCLKSPHKSNGKLYVYGWRYDAEETKKHMDREIAKLNPEIRGAERTKIIQSIKRVYKWFYFGPYNDETFDKLKSNKMITDEQLKALQDEYESSNTLRQLMIRRIDYLATTYSKAQYKQDYKGNKQMIAELVDKMTHAGDSEEDIKKAVKAATLPGRYKATLEKKYMQYKTTRLTELFEKHMHGKSLDEAREDAMAEFLVTEDEELTKWEAAQQAS